MSTESKRSIDTMTFAAANELPHGFDVEGRIRNHKCDGWLCMLTPAEPHPVRQLSRTPGSLMPRVGCHGECESGAPHGVPRFAFKPVWGAAAERPRPASALPSSTFALCTFRRQEPKCLPPAARGDWELTDVMSS